MLQLLIGSALMGISAWLLLKNQLNGGPGMMIVASIIGGRVLAPMVQMMMQLQLALNARESWVRLNSLLAANPAAQPSMPLPAPRGVLTVEQLVAGAPPLPGQQNVALPYLEAVVQRAAILATALAASADLLEDGDE